MDSRWNIKTNWTGKNDIFVQDAVYLANCRVQARKTAIKAMEANKEIKKKTKEFKKEVIADFTDWTYGCMALAMHRKYKWGAKRISRLLEELEVIRAELIAQNLDSAQIWDIVRDEIRLDVSVVDGFDWED